jgi:hypothetical protein
MSRKFLTAVDLGKNELQNAVVQNLASAPSSPVKGQLYFNSTGGDNTLYWWDGTAWVPAKSSGGAFPGYGTVPAETTFGIARSDGVATTTARSDHTHGTPTHVNADHAAINLNALAAPTGNVNLNNFSIINLGPPSSGTDATNKTYVDNAIAGLAWKDPVRLASTANVAVTGLTAIDGVTPLGGDRVLLKNQTSSIENGIWVASAGAWTRATDADAGSEMEGMAAFVMEGTTNADTSWVCTTNAPITPGSTALTFVQFAGGGTVTAGAGLTQSGNTLNVGAGTGITVNADDIAIGDAELLAIAGLTSSANQLPYFTGSGTAALTPLTNAGRTLIDDASFPIMLTTLGAAAQITTISAGTGLTGGGDLSTNRTLSLDTTYTDGRYAAVASGVKRYAADIGGSTSQVVSHNLNTVDTIVQVYRKASPFDQIECDVEHTTVNTTTVRFTTAPAAAEYRIVVMA